MSVNSSKTSVIYRRLLRYVLLKFEGQQSLARWSIKMSPAAADVAVVLSLFSARHVTLKIAAVALLLDRFASWLTDNISYLFLHIIILITSWRRVKQTLKNAVQNVKTYAADAIVYANCIWVSKPIFKLNNVDWIWNIYRVSQQDLYSNLCKENVQFPKL